MPSAVARADEECRSRALDTLDTLSDAMALHKAQIAEETGLPHSLRILLHQQGLALRCDLEMTAIAARDPEVSPQTLIAATADLVQAMQELHIRACLCGPEPSTTLSRLGRRLRATNA